MSRKARKERPAGPSILDDALIRARQKSRSLVTGVMLGALALLFYAIALVRMMGGN